MISLNVSKHIRQCVLGLLCCLLFSTSCIIHNGEPFPNWKEAPTGFFEKSSAAPFLFFVLVNKTFFIYHQKYGHYPEYWSECDQIAIEGEKILRERTYLPGKESRPLTKEDRFLNLEKNKTLTTYDRVKDHKYYYKYTIVRSDKNGFEIHAESNYFPYIWATDGTYTWHFYKDPNEEDRIVEGLNKKILSFFIGESERMALMYKLIMFKNDKALAYSVSYLKRFEGDNLAVFRLISNMKQSSILKQHPEYKDNVEAAARKYPNDAYIQKCASDVLEAFDHDKEVPANWKGIEEWVFMIPYGRNAADQ